MPKKWSVRRSPNFGPSLLANPVYGLQCSRNVCRAIKLKLHIVRDVIKTRAELVNAECKIWILEVYVLNLYASIPRQLYSVVAKKYFFYKVLYWFVSVYKSMPFVVEFSCKFCTTTPSWLLILDHKLYTVILTNTYTVWRLQWQPCTNRQTLSVTCWHSGCFSTNMPSARTVHRHTHQYIHSVTAAMTAMYKQTNTVSHLLTLRLLQYKHAISTPVKILGDFWCVSEQMLRWQTKHFNHLHHLIKLHNTAMIWAHTLQSQTIHSLTTCTDNSSRLPASCYVSIVLLR